MKPLAGFAGLSGEWRDLAAVVSRVRVFQTSQFSCFKSSLNLLYIYITIPCIRVKRLCFSFAKSLVNQSINHLVHLHENKTNFHMKSLFALGLGLKQAKGNLEITY